MVVNEVPWIAVYWSKLEINSGLTLKTTLQGIGLDDDDCDYVLYYNDL